MDLPVWVAQLLKYQLYVLYVHVLRAQFGPHRQRAHRVEAIVYHHLKKGAGARLVFRAFQPYPLQRRAKPEGAALGAETQERRMRSALLCYVLEVPDLHPALQARVKIFEI